MIRYVSILLMLLSAPCFSAWPDDSICRVQSTSISSVADGTGEIVGMTDTSMLMMTTAHVILIDSSIQAIWADGLVQQGKLLSVDRDKELAIFTVPLLTTKMPLVLGRSLKEHASYVGKGYIGSGVPRKLATVEGKFTNTKEPFFELDKPNEQGTSGGPVFDDSGRMIGVMVARDNKLKTTIAVNADTIAKFLAPYKHQVAVKNARLDSNDVELTRLLRSRRTIQVKKPAIPYQAPVHKNEVVVEHVNQVEQVVEDADEEPQFNFPVQTDDLDYATGIQEEVNEQVNEIGGASADVEKPDTTALPDPVTPPQTNETSAPVDDTKPAKTEDKLDAIAAAQATLLQTINNNVSNSNVDLTPVVNALHDSTAQMNQIVSLLNEIKTQGSTPTPPTVEKAPLPLVLVTSTFLCNDCPGVEAKAKEIRDKKGINIRIVKLDGVLNGLTPEQKTNIKLTGVPVLYDFGANRTIVGSVACLEFLSSL